MTLAVIDVGNTSTAAGLWTDGVLSHVVHCDGARAAAAVSVDEMLRDAPVRAIAYASVVPREDAAWRVFAASRGVPLVNVDASLVERSGIFTIDYPDPSTIGADRLADAAGAVRRYGKGVLVMDFGTALTAAAVDSAGVWRGGAIAPGLPLVCDYFHERTAKLPRLEPSRIGAAAPAAPPRSTEEAMLFGAIYGALGMAKEIASRLSESLGGGLKLVATGGYAGRVLSAGDAGDWTIDRDLTLFGAGLLAAEGGMTK